MGDGQNLLWSGWLTSLEVPHDDRGGLRPTATNTDIGWREGAVGCRWRVI